MKIAIQMMFLFLLLSAHHLKAQQLPFDIKGKEWKHYKASDSLFNSGRYAKAVKEYEKCSKLITSFPTEQYKYALSLWMIKDTVKARKIFRNSINSGLKFDDPQTLQMSPLIRELSGDNKTYQQLRQTVYYDDVAEETREYKLLQELRELDQHFRTEAETDRANFQRADSINRERFKPLLKLWNWPGIRETGYQGEGAAFLIAQHSDDDLKFQKDCLERMEREFYKGNVTISSYAMLIDRYLVNTERKQVFGTQVQLNEETKKFEPKPLLYPNEVQSLRNLFGLGDLQAYLQLMEKNNENRYK